MDILQLEECIRRYIFDDETLRSVNDMNTVVSRVERMFADPVYLHELRASDKNWLDISVDETIDRVMSFLKSITSE